MRASALCIFPLVAACAGTHSHQPVKAEGADLAEFDRVSVVGSLDVQVEVGAAPSVALKGARHDLEHLSLVVTDGTLEISKTGDHRMHDVEIRVTTPQLRGAVLSGSGDITVSGVSADAFEAELRGSGDIDVQGTAKSVSVSVRGSGDVDTSGLKATSAGVRLSGSGDAHVHATKDATGTLRGSGDIVVGGGATCSIEVAGSGDVSC